jgi:hypothetical protein
MLAGWFANLLESKEIDQSHLVDHDVFAQNLVTGYL